jgi:predicted cobalt transporter CbtA
MRVRLRGAMFSGINMCQAIHGFIAGVNLSCVTAHLANRVIYAVKTLHVASACHSAQRRHGHFRSAS